MITPKKDIASFPGHHEPKQELLKEISKVARQAQELSDSMAKDKRELGKLKDRLLTLYQKASEMKDA